MEWLIILVVILIIINIMVSIKKSKIPSKKIDYKYEKIKILTNNESTFYNELKRIAVRVNIDVLVKVRLCDIIKVKSGTEKSTYNSAFNTIKSKHIDFVLIDRNANVLCCIELDDKSHEKEKAKTNDEVKNKALLSAKVPLIRTRDIHGVEDKIFKEIQQIKKD